MSNLYLEKLPGEKSCVLYYNATGLFWGESEIIILNYAVFFFSPVLTDTETVTKINFFLKKLYIQFAVDIP